MFVDEVGNSDMGSSDDPNHRYLSLTGVMAADSEYDAIIDPGFSNLKQEVFGTTNIVLHRREILDRRPPFECLRESSVAERFDDALISLLSNLPYEIVTVAIDKRAHRDRYKAWHFHPYHYCMTLLLERYTKWLRRRNGYGDVLAESRNRVDDEKLKGTYETFQKKGSNYVKEVELLERLTSRNLKLRKKHANINGLQLADIIASPSLRSMVCSKLNQQMTAPFGKKVVAAIDSKYDRGQNGLVWGNGKKWLP